MQEASWTRLIHGSVARSLGLHKVDAEPSGDMGPLNSHLAYHNRVDAARLSMSDHAQG
jgi:hypothetical protein